MWGPNTPRVSSLFLGHFGAAFAAKPLQPRVAGHAVSGRATGRFALAPLLLLGVERVALRPGLRAASLFSFL